MEGINERLKNIKAEFEKIENEKTGLIKEIELVRSENEVLKESVESLEKAHNALLDMLGELDEEFDREVI